VCFRAGAWVLCALRERASLSPPPHTHLTTQVIGTGPGPDDDPGHTHPALHAQLSEAWPWGAAAVVRAQPRPTAAGAAAFAPAAAAPSPSPLPLTLALHSPLALSHSPGPGGFHLRFHLRTAGPGGRAVYEGTLPDPWTVCMYHYYGATGYYSRPWLPLRVDPPEAADGVYVCVFKGVCG
jgi:hypothetical protein